MVEGYLSTVMFYPEIKKRRLHRINVTRLYCTSVCAGLKFQGTNKINVWNI